MNVKIEIEDGDGDHSYTAIDTIEIVKKVTSFLSDYNIPQCTFGKHCFRDNKFRIRTFAAKQYKPWNELNPALKEKFRIMKAFIEDSEAVERLKQGKFSFAEVGLNRNEISTRYIAQNVLKQLKKHQIEPHIFLKRLLGIGSLDSVRKYLLYPKLWDELYEGVARYYLKMFVWLNDPNKFEMFKNIIINETQQTNELNLSHITPKVVLKRLNIDTRGLNCGSGGLGLQSSIQIYSPPVSSQSVEKKKTLVSTSISNQEKKSSGKPSELLGNLQRENKKLEDKLRKSHQEIEQLKRFQEEGEQQRSKMQQQNEQFKLSQQESEQQYLKLYREFQEQKKQLKRKDEELLKLRKNGKNIANITELKLKLQEVSTLALKTSQQTSTEISELKTQLQLQKEKFQDLNYRTVSSEIEKKNFKVLLNQLMGQQQSMNQNLNYLQQQSLQNQSLQEQNLQQLQIQTSIPIKLPVQLQQATLRNENILSVPE